MKKPANLEETKFIDDFSEEVFKDSYSFKAETIVDRHWNTAADLASVEGKDADYWAKEFYRILCNFKFMPGGRILSNAGTGLTKTTYINCFVSGFQGREQDSIESIMDELKRQALILKSEGGYGFCVNALRPRGSFIHGIANQTVGAVRMLDMWDTQAAVIVEGSGLKSDAKKGKVKIRKSAQMVTMGIWHPDIEEFITAKKTKNKLTKFNMSVLVSNEFMDAVEQNKSWNLEFPDYESCIEIYNEEWDGNIKKWKEKGYPVKIYKTFKDANELWNLITERTYLRNEPGILFEDFLNYWNNLWYLEYLNATNPCGEQILPINGSCLLGSLNLTQYIDLKTGKWNYKALAKDIPTAIRFMDNVNDRTFVPLKAQKEELLNKRRIGLGIVGYGSALMMMKIKYGSEKALEITDEVMSFIANTAYQSSALLAKEKGAFPLFDAEKYLSGNFIKTLKPETIEMIRKYGMRNSHVLSIQPTGNSSVLANNVTSGQEPLVDVGYIRTAIIAHAPDGLEVPKHIDWAEKTFDKVKNEWAWKRDGDEDILRTEFGGSVYKIDPHRGLTKESVVEDYSIKYLKSIGEWDENADYIATIKSLTISEHINTMAVLSKYIDSAMSKTINVPNDYPFEDFKKVYFDAWKTGTIKGVTTYRIGTMASVVASLEDNLSDVELNGKEITRPESVDCDIYHLTVNNANWIVLVGIVKNKPFEVFAFKRKHIKLSENLTKGKLVKVKSKHFNLITDHITIEDIREYFESDEQEALTRMISLNLRYGVPMDKIYKQLTKTEGTIVSFSKAVSRTLKNYISPKITLDCDACGAKDSLVMEDGCFICRNCSTSKCS